MADEQSRLLQTTGLRRRWFFESLIDEDVIRELKHPPLLVDRDPVLGTSESEAAVLVRPFVDHARRIRIALRSVNERFTIFAGLVAAELCPGVESCPGARSVHPESHAPTCRYAEFWTSSAATLAKRDIRND